MARGTLHLGTSGFAYLEWKGTFYPAEVRSDGMLAYYATEFSSVEINYTFQRSLSEKTAAKWAASTPEGFSFSPKAHRQITHNARLRDVGEPLSSFLKSISPLGSRLGAVLFQCPPNLPADQSRLEEVLAALPGDRRFAFEFRHPSWDTPEVRQSLEARGVAWCVVDTEEADARIERTAQAFVYLRLRRSTYEPEDLGKWAVEIEALLNDGVDVYCYLKHTDDARGVGFARTLRDMVSARAQPSALDLGASSDGTLA